MMQASSVVLIGANFFTFASSISMPSPGPCGHQRDLALHRERRLQVVLGDVLRPVQVDRIVMP